MKTRWKLGPTLAMTMVAVLLANPARAQVEKPQVEQQAQAQAEQRAKDLPDGAAVIARYVEAIGGAAAFERLAGWMALGRLEIPSQGLRGTMQVYAAPPARRLTKIEMTGIGTVRSGTDGRVAWSIHPAMGAQLLRGRMLDQYRQDANFLSTLHRKGDIDSVVTMGVENFEGRPCHRLRVTTSWGESYTEYFDVATGLLAGSERKLATPAGEIPAVTIVSDYKRTGGALMPRKFVQRMLKMEQVVTVDSVLVAGVDSSVFELPKEIQALVAKSAAK